MNRRGWSIAVVIVLLGVALGLLGRGQAGGGLPFDPRSTEPAGTAAFVEVLRELGADVEITAGAPAGDRDVAVVLVAGRDDAERDRLEGWVRAGGRLVLADPSSAVNPAAVRGSSAFDLFGSVPLAVACGEHPALQHLARVSSTTWTAMRAPDDSTVSCLPMDEGVGLFATSLGDGELVVFGGRGAWTNDRLGEHHNAALAVALVQPAPGVRVSVVGPPPPGAGERRLADLVPGRVRGVLWQLAIAFGVLAWARSRRLGPPPEEGLPTRIRGSEMVAAVGGLLERRGGRQTAALALQEDLARSIAAMLGVPSATPRDALVEIASARTGMSQEQLRSALGDREIADDRQLVGLARSIVAVRDDLGLSTGGPGVSSTNR